MKLRNISRGLCRYTKIVCAICASFALIQTQSVRAGWTGFVNGAGYGWVYVSMSSGYGTANAKIGGPDFQPGESIPNDAPDYASYYSYTYGSGYAGGYMQGEAFGYYGDGADNPDIRRRIIIDAAPCAQLKSELFFTPKLGGFPHPYFDPHDQQTKTGIDFDGTSGTITVNSKGTAGTALLVLGWEWLGDTNAIPSHFPVLNPDNTVLYETVEDFFKANGGVKKFESLTIGNHEFGGDKCSLVVPFSLKSGDPTKLFIQLSGEVKSTPLVLNFPTDKTVECGQTVKYADVTVASGGCGANLTNLFANYSPDPSTLHLGENMVTVNVTDDPGHLNIIQTSSFKLTILDTTKPEITATGTPVNGVLGLNPSPQQIEDALGTATATDNCGLLTPTPQDSAVTQNGCSRSQMRTWNVTDASGNAAIAVSRTVTWTQDNTPPTVSLAAYTIPCGSTLPVNVPVPTTFTSSDNCGGPVTVVQTQAQSYNGGPGVTWTFKDVAGNETQVLQPVNTTTLTFLGFYSPIGTVNNSISSPVTRNLGSTLPIKFDMKCGNTFVTGGTPPNVQFQKMKPNGQTDGDPVTLVATYQNDWHINFPTEQTGAKKNDIFKITVLAPGGTTPMAYVYIKFN